MLKYNTLKSMTKRETRSSTANNCVLNKYYIVGTLCSLDIRNNECKIHTFHE